MLGIDQATLTSGPKPDDLELVECHEDWSHTGTPQWACSEDGPREDEPSSAPQHGQSDLALARSRPCGHARSRGPPTVQGCPLGPRRSALAAWMPKRGCSDALAPFPKSPTLPPLSLQSPTRKFQPLRMLTNPLRKTVPETTDSEAA